MQTKTFLIAIGYELVVREQLNMNRGMPTHLRCYIEMNGRVGMAQLHFIENYFVLFIMSNGKIFN